MTCDNIKTVSVRGKAYVDSRFATEITNNRCFAVPAINLILHGVPSYEPRLLLACMGVLDIDPQSQIAVNSLLVSETIISIIYMVINLKKYPSGDPIRSGGSVTWSIQTESAKGELMSSQQKFTPFYGFTFQTQLLISVFPEYQHSMSSRMFNTNYYFFFDFQPSRHHNSAIPLSNSAASSPYYKPGVSEIHSTRRSEVDSVFMTNDTSFSVGHLSTLFLKQFSTMFNIYYRTPDTEAICDMRMKILLFHGIISD
ncbi:hypothetical protein RF11_12170 [Thelohanellus kitauei]|uniref:Uncharacterized protein n=1 Tax=Thelohanellus kitauei TaxID=669202 RepID=A0A0C2M7J0_THEKT|nr:hypothetical protein RF11_12170 [Thelohanellus kitauei]